VAIVLAWLRLDARRRWRSLAVLALLVAVAGATVLAAVAGARRQASAVSRLHARTLPATAAILANTPGFDWSRIRALPEVEALMTFGASFPIEKLPPDIEADVLSGDEVLHTIEKPVIFSGRLPDPTRADEAAVSRGFVQRVNKGVGDTVKVTLPTPKEFEAQEGSGPNGRFTGPRITLRIVGVIATAWFSDAPDHIGGLFMSPGVVARYPLNTVGDLHNPHSSASVNALVRLRGGEAAVPVLREDVARIIGRPDIDVWNVAEEFTRPLERHTSFEARCLLAFAAAAFLAAVFLVGQAIARYAAASAAEMQTLRSLGMTPSQAIAAAASAPAIVGVLAAGVAVGAAYVASQWLPIGAAALAEPSPGLSADWAVFTPGLVLIWLLVAATGVLAAWSAVRAGRRPVAPRRSSVASAASRAGLPVPLVIGSRFALEAGRGPTSVPVRPALIGAVTGVLGILAAFTFSHGVSDAAGHPERFGQTFQLVAFLGDNGQTYGPADTLTKALVADPDVTGVNDARVSVASGAKGIGSVTLYSYNAGAKPLDVVVITGRVPRSAGEVLLAPRSLKTMRAHVGGTVLLAGNKQTPRRLVVTGSGLVPNGFHNGYDDGGWVTDAGYDALFTGHKFRLEYVALRPGARSPHASQTLTAAIAKGHPDLSNFGFRPPDTLTEVRELREVRGMPIMLGVFLALLAVGAVGHALATAVRRRAHDLAVLRALGMTQWQCRWVVVTQATVFALAGLVFGVPLGVALGRTVWRAVSNYTPFQYVAPTNTLVLFLVIPAALVIANVLAAWPGRRAASMRISHILRTE
jgi:cell division protein FtsX